MTQGFDMGGGAYSRYETYPEQRQDGSVWEVTFDKETGTYASREVLPPEPPRPTQTTRDDMMGARFGPPSPGGSQAKLFAPLPEPSAPTNDWLGEGGYVPPPPPVPPNEPPAVTPPNLRPAWPRTSNTAVPNYGYDQPEPGSGVRPTSNQPWVQRYDNQYAYNGPAYNSSQWQSTQDNPYAPNSFYGPAGQPNLQSRPTGATSQGGATNTGNINAGEGRGNGRPQSDAQPNTPPPGPDAARKEFGDIGPWAHGYGPRYEQYSERRADGSTAIVTFDRATGKYSSADTAGNAMPNAGGGAPAGGGGRGNGGGIDINAFTSNPANAAWWQEFQYQHQGMDPITYYMQYNNYSRRNDARRDANGRALPPTETEALQMALADRAWGDALFRERGFAPTQSDWMSHYYANSPAPYRGMSNEYRGGPGDVGAYAGRGGAASGTASGGGPWKEGPDGKPTWTGG